MSKKGKSIGLFNKLSRKSLTDLSEWNKNDDKLMQCVEESNLKEIQLLLKKKKVCSTKLDPQGHSALHVAAMRNKFDVMQMLIAYGADVTAVDFQGRTALHCAARHGASEVIEVLSHSKEDNWPTDDCKMTAMHHACIGGNIDCVISLIRKYPRDLEAKDEDGRSSLFYAAQIGHHHVCKELLDRGADINIQDNIGRTALMYAAENGNHQICELFLKKGADKEITDNQGRAAVWHAMDAGHTVVKNLIEPSVTEKETLEVVQSDISAKNRAVSPILEETDSIMGEDVISLAVSDDLSEDIKDIEVDFLDENNNSQDEDEDPSAYWDEVSELESDTLSDTGDDGENDDEESISHLSEISYTMSHKRETSIKLPEADTPRPATAVSESTEAMQEQITPISPHDDLLTMEEGVSLSTDESESDSDEDDNTEPAEAAQTSTSQTSVYKVLQKEHESLKDDFSIMQSEHDEAKKLLKDYSNLKERLVMLEEERHAETASREREALEDMDMVLQMSDLKSKLHDEEERNSILESRLEELQNLISANKKEEELAVDSWPDDDSDDEEFNTRSGVKKEVDIKPVAKVSGQPRKMSWKDENREIAKLKQDIESLEHQKTSMSQTISKLQEQQVELELKYEQVSSHIATTEANFDKKSKECEVLTKEALEIRKLSAKQQENAKTMTDKHQAYKKEVERLRKKIELYEREYKKVREKLKRRDASEKKMLKDRHIMMRKLDEMNKKLKEAEKRNSQIAINNTELKEENEELLYNCDELAAEIVRLRDELDDKQYDVEQLNTMAQCNEELMTLKQQEVASLEKQIQLMRDGALQPQRRSSFGSDNHNTIKSLQKQIARIQTQLAETANSHQETLEVYRNHLILASQNMLDPQVKQALQCIIELRRD